MTDYNIKRHKQREETEKRILEEAILLFGQKGYANTSVKEIAEASGVAVGLVGKYFATKEILLSECYRHATTISYPLSEKELNERESIVKLVENTVTIYKEKHAYYQFFRTMMTASDLPKEYIDARREFFHNAPIYPHIIHKQEAGVLKDENPYSLFMIFMRMVYNIVELNGVLLYDGERNATFKTVELIMNTVENSYRQEEKGE